MRVTYSEPPHIFRSGAGELAEHAELARSRRVHTGTGSRSLQVQEAVAVFARGLQSLGHAMVTPLKFVGDERALVEALRSGHPGAAAALYERYASAVHRALRSAVGPDPDLPDLLQEVFIRALDSIEQLEDHARLRSWLAGIAVFSARALIRRRTRRKWLSLFSPQRVASAEQAPPSSEARLALMEVYELLNRLPLDERMAFALRIIDGMTLPDAAEACGVSLATFKRRLARAERAFMEAAELRPQLEPWLRGGTKWILRKQG